MVVKVILSIGPTFHESELDVYHKSQVTVEFDDSIDDEEDVTEKMIEQYFKLISIERQAVKDVRNGKVAVCVKDFLAEVRESMDDD